MKARKKPVEIEYYPCEVEYLKDIMKWSTDKRPITIVRDNLLKIQTLE